LRFSVQFFREDWRKLVVFVRPGRVGLV
jgi:hypothetical protein